MICIEISYCVINKKATDSHNWLMIYTVVSYGRNCVQGFTATLQVLVSVLRNHGRHA